MIKSILILLIGIIVMILTSPLALIAYIFSKKGKYDPPSKFGVAVLQALAKFFCRLSGCVYHIEGQENIPDTPAVFVGNHQGDYDAFLILFALGEPKVIMAKKEVKVIPIANLWMVIIKCIFVDRKNHKKAMAAMMAMICGTVSADSPAPVEVPADVLAVAVPVFTAPVAATPIAAALSVAAAASATGLKSGFILLASFIMASAICLPV